MAFPDKIIVTELAGFRQTPEGTTRPRHGYIGGVHYLAKCGAWSPFSSDAHVRNEFVADSVIRGMGFRVPESRLYEIGVGKHKRMIRLSRFLDGAKPLGDTLKYSPPSVCEKIRRQAVDSYPLLHLMDCTDTYQGYGLDNILVDSNCDLWYVDNGCSFDFRARGQRKEFDVFSRRDPYDPAHGFLSLRRHPMQFLLRRALGDTPDAALWDSAAKFDVGRYISLLPAKGYHRRTMRAYAFALRSAATAATND